MIQIQIHEDKYSQLEEMLLPEERTTDEELSEAGYANIVIPIGNWRERIVFVPYFNEEGFYQADKITMEGFRKYLGMPDATLEDLLRRCKTLVAETERKMRKELRGAINVTDFAIKSRYRTALEKLLALIVKLNAPDNCLIETEMKKIAEEALGGIK